LARVIALLRRLDLDHARPELGEQQGAVWARENAREIDYRDAGKRPPLSHGAAPFAMSRSVNTVEHGSPATGLPDLQHRIV
jgi:hypothetical protein